MVRIRRIGVVSVANVAAAITFVITFLFVVLFALVALPMLGELRTNSQLGLPGGGGIVVLFIAPFIYAALGWVSGAISALVYNLVAGFTGGVQMELDGQVAPAASAPTTGQMPPAPPAAPAPHDPPPPQG